MRAFILGTFHPIQPLVPPALTPRDSPRPFQGSIVCRNLNFPFSVVMITAGLVASRFASSLVRPVAPTKSMPAKASFSFLPSS